MLIEPWLLVHAVDLAVQASTHAVHTATTLEHQAHSFLVEITNEVGPPSKGGPFVDGGCHEDGGG